MGNNERTYEDGAVDADEVDRFDAIAAEWWDEKGPMRPLHRMNPVRLAFIQGALAARPDRPPPDRPPEATLDGLDLLDVGCGAGLLAEPLARLGASVTGIDPSERAIEAARRHAEAGGLDVRYRPATAGQLLDEGLRFDAVTALEVIEHVPDPEGFAYELASLLRPGGVLVLSTLNRTPSSFAKAIVGAEYALRWLPRGTHDWRRFLKPSEAARLLRMQGLDVFDLAGIGYDPGRDRFALSKNRDTNYILAARKVG